MVCTMRWPLALLAISPLPGPLLTGPLRAQDPAPLAVPPDASADAITSLAATVRPTPRQLAWQATGCNAFVHFGMNTFTDREWGDGTEDPRQFAPSDFDANQWANTFRAAGMRGLVLTAKHHDGFCLWPSRSTQHTVAAAPFRGGKGDVVGEVAAACRAAGLAFGVYLSPWDRHEPTFGTKAYQQVFLQQLRELCTDYGPLFEVWFDGAHCPPDEPSRFDWQAVFALVRELQPNAVIAITGPDVRWVGNEAGQTRADEWSVLPLASPAPGPFATDRQSWRALWALRERNQERELGGRHQLTSARALCWWPAETDVSIRPGWFHHPSEDARVKSLAELLEIWFGSVGGNAVLLLNVPPDRRGRIADPDVQVLRDLGAWLDATFQTDLGSTGTLRVYPKVREITLPQAATVDLFEIAEDLAAGGQRVEAFRIEVLQGGGWRDCARGTTIGARRLLRTEPVTGDGFRVWIEKSRAAPQLAAFRLFRRPLLLEPPAIRRTADGTVTLTANGPVHYTLDGSAPSAESPRYLEPFALPDGGLVRAVALPPAGGRALALASGAVASAHFGLAPAGFRVLDCSSEQGGTEAAAKAIDGDPRTHWHSRWSPDSPKPPHHVSVDLGRTVLAHGFLYQARAEGSNGTIAEYEFLGSLDGVAWRVLAKGTFANVEQQKEPQRVRFAAAEEVRYVRLRALREVQRRDWASCAELTVLVQ